jgi:hypothetical protein
MRFPLFVSTLKSGTAGTKVLVRTGAFSNETTFRAGVPRCRVTRSHR